MRPLNILIVDDQKEYRESLARTLQAEMAFDRIALASDSTSAHTVLARMNIDIVLLDVRMPGMDGATAVKYIKRQNPEVKVVILSGFDDDEYICRAIENGATGYLLKGLVTAELVVALKAVLGGLFQLSPEVATKLVHEKIRRSIRQPRPNISTWYLAMNFREREILHLLARGYTNREIGSIIFLSEQTIKNYCSQIYRHMNVANRVDAINKAIKEGLFD